MLRDILDWKKVYSLNFSYIFLLDVNFENMTFGLHVFIILSMLSMRYLKFLW